MPTEFRMSTRHLSAAETVMDIMQDFGANQVLHVAILRSNAPLTESLLHDSLKILTQYQTALRMKIVSETRQQGGTKRRFVELDDVSIDVEVIRGTDRCSWVPIAESELSIPIQAHIGPLWRVKFVDFAEIDADSRSVRTESTFGSEAVVEGALLFVIHQAIADGISMFHMLFSQLLPIINAVIGGEDTSRYRLPLSMMHASDDAFLEKTKKPWNKKASVKGPQVSKQMTPDIETFRPILSCVAKNAEPVETSASGILPFSMSGLGTRILFEECHKQNTSVHSALLMACGSAFGMTCKSLPEAQGLEELTAGFSVDLRQFRTGDDSEPLGMWEGYQTERMKRFRSLPMTEKFWDESRRIYANYRSSRSKPWKILATYNNALGCITKDGNLSAVADMFGVNFQLDNLGDCDDHLRIRKARDTSTPSTSRSSRSSSIEKPKNGLHTQRPKSARSSSMEGLRNSRLLYQQNGLNRISLNPQNGTSVRTNRLSKVASIEVPQNGSIFPPKRSSRTSSIEVQNGLQYNGSSINSSYGDFVRLDEHYFMRSMSDVNPVPFIVSVCVFRGRLMWTVTYNKRWITRRFATEYVDILIRVIKHVVSTDIIPRGFILLPYCSGSRRTSSDA